MTSLCCFHSKHSSLSYSQMIINRISVLIKLCSFMTMLVKLPLRCCCHPVWDRITQIIIECSYCYCIFNVFRVFNSYSLTLACLLIYIIVIEPGIWLISCLVINSRKKNMYDYSHMANTGRYYSDVIMSTMSSKVTGVSVVYSTVCSVLNQIIYQSSASLTFERGIHRWPMISPHKRPVTRKMVSIDDVIMCGICLSSSCKYLALSWSNHFDFLLPNAK